MLLNELTNLAASIPEANRLEIGRVLAGGPWVDPGDLPRIVLHEVLGLVALRKARGLRLSKGRHVIILAGFLRLLKIVEVDGMNVIDDIRKLL